MTATSKSLRKVYKGLTSEERARVWLCAASRGDEGEARFVSETAPERTYTMRDARFYDRLRAFEKAAESIVFALLWQGRRCVSLEGLALYSIGKRASFEEGFAEGARQALAVARGASKSKRLADALEAFEGEARLGSMILADEHVEQAVDARFAGWRDDADEALCVVAGILAAVEDCEVVLGVDALALLPAFYGEQGETILAEARDFARKAEERLVFARETLERAESEEPDEEALESGELDDEELEDFDVEAWRVAARERLARLENAKSEARELTLELLAQDFERYEESA